MTPLKEKLLLIFVYRLNKKIVVSHKVFKLKKNSPHCGEFL